MAILAMPEHGQDARGTFPDWLKAGVTHLAERSPRRPLQIPSSS